MFSTLWGDVRKSLEKIGDYGMFSARALQTLFQQPPKYRDIIDQLDSLGVQSLVILIATGLFVGMAITLILEAEMDIYGAKVYIGRMLAVATVRELAPVFTALMLAGRVGARIASELGSMRVTQQIDSIEGLGQDPMQKLVAPRLLALLIMVPALTMVVNLITLLGGFLVSSVSPGTFWFEARKAFVPRHLVGGLLKPFVFGYIIATVSCFLGMRAAQGVRGVGEASARAVVNSSVLVFLANYIVGFIVLKIFGV
ncbi:MAG: ABC transporter permease [Candidatus Firestonebacteria bacterium]|nr:ABC transporter permease [Candidatus Firestonebacteria bacterium]